MPRITTSLHGTAQLRSALRQLGGSERREAQRDGLEAGARIVEAWAKIEAPVDTGALMGSIAVDAVTELEAVIAPHVDYAEDQEFGTMYQEGHAYMRPALDNHEGEIIGAVTNEITAFIRRVRG